MVQETDRTGQVLLSVAEELKLPLLAISRHAELGAMTGEGVDLQMIRAHADAALSLVDSYLLGLRLLRDQTMLELEPVSISSTLVDTAHELSRYAKQYGMGFKLDIAGRYEPVMAHQAGLRSALISLGYGLVESQAALGQKELTLGVHRTAKGLTVGLYGVASPLSTEEWRTALSLCGEAPQPFSSLSSGASAGIFVAHTILQAMEAKLRVGKRSKHYGLATTLQPSQQLQFV